MPIGPSGAARRLVAETELRAKVDALCERLALHMGDGADWTVVALMHGAFVFAADVMRGLARRGIDPVYDALWLESYGDLRESSGRVRVRADLSRSIQNKRVLILDDVLDTGRTLAFARAHVLAQGAREACAAVLVRKIPCPAPEAAEFFALEVENGFLIGYGLDDAGRGRGWPDLWAL